ncbi:MAG: glycosyltransferase family 4 protein [Anaerolineae bacterium]|nr:glycosyltransferase family 4 protein [Candidatus Roseilinea sp.]MDW8448415.1 glycosyltransferase family 4 protein [Anaerolineae bacterium]
MKIVLPVHHFPPRYTAGGEQYVHRLARWLQEHDCDVEVVCLESIETGKPDRVEAWLDHYDGLRVWRLSYDLMRAPQRKRWTFDSEPLRAWFAGYLRDARPDVIHFHAGYLLGVGPLFEAASAGVPSVLTLHDYWFLCPRHTLLRSEGTLCEEIPEDPAGCAWCRYAEERRYRVTMNRLSLGLFGKVMQAIGLENDSALISERRARLAEAIRLPRMVISPSRFLARYFEGIVDPERLRVVRFGFDLARFRAIPAPPSDGAVRIGYIGQIAHHKGVHLLIRAFRSLNLGARQVELHIYGSLKSNPAYVAQLKSLASGDARVHFEGPFENARVAEVMKRLSALVVPSIWFENSPLVILESLSAGTPVITANIGGMAELVQDGVDGLHFAAGSASHLARQLQRLVDDPDLLARLRQGAAASPAPRSIDDEMTDLMSIYRELI